LIQRRHRVTAGLSLTGDLLATLAAFLATYWLRFDLLLETVGKNAPEADRYLWPLLPVVLVVWPVVFYFHGLYQVRRGRSRVDELLTLVVAVLLAAVLLSVFFTWYRPPGAMRPDGSFEYFTYSRLFLALFAGLDLVFVATGRLALRSYLRWRRLHGGNLQRILIVGAGVNGREIGAKLLAHREFGLEVVGYLDDDSNKQGKSFDGVSVLGTTRQIEEVLEERRIDQVYVALPLEAHRRMMRVLQVVGKECVEVKLVPDILQYATLNATIEDVDGTPVINLSQTPMQGWHSMVKRLMDLALAGAALLVLLPLLPLVAALIWFEDRGPVFYRQERMGLDGRPFMILKFRSMRVNAEATTGPVWATRDDPRRTRIGDFLRRWSLDELPQIWNVLRGDMSLIGPRPERPAFVREFKHKIPQYMLRHRVKAGITGWAQVHGWRGNTSIKKRLQYDLYYIENWSLLLDLKILWMTLRSGLRHHNAY
jgi:exopolysaccharide biosynthesis polyprenyl glycosylphosphotransferase